MSGWNWTAVVALVVGAFIALGGAYSGLNADGTPQGPFPQDGLIPLLKPVYDYSWIAGLLVAFVVFFVLDKIVPVEEGRSGLRRGAVHPVGAGCRAGRLITVSWGAVQAPRSRCTSKGPLRRRGPSRRGPGTWPGNGPSGPTVVRRPGRSCRAPQHGWRSVPWPTCRPSSPASASRTRSCWRRRRRPSPSRNIMRAFEAGWGGVVTKTIGLHPVVNVARPEDEVPARRRRRHAASRWRSARTRRCIASWNWELISDKPLDWWVPRLESDQEGLSRSRPRRVDHGRLGQRQGARALADAGEGRARTTAPTRSSSTSRARTWTASTWARTSARTRSCARSSTQVVKEVARVPVWVKLTPATTDIVEEATRDVPRRRRRDLLVEHVPVAAARSIPRRSSSR